MEVTFIKDHLKNKSGQVTDVSDSRAAYLIRMGVAAAADDDDDSGETVEKKLTHKLKAAKKKAKKKTIKK